LYTYIIIPSGGVGRHAQAKLVKAPGDKVRWPQKATKIVLDLVKNAESNATVSTLVKYCSMIVYVNVDACNAVLLLQRYSAMLRTMRYAAAALVSVTFSSSSGL
jgi:hypothetical protein